MGRIVDKTDEWESRVDRERAEGARTEQPKSTKYKDGNPKTALGIKKPSTWYTPPIPYFEYSLAHMQGAFKYGPFNWRDDPVSISTYIDAAIRHLEAFKAGEQNADDSGIHHLAHAMCCCSIIIDAEAHGTLIDDRKTTIRHGAKPEQPGFVLADYIKGTEPRIKKIYDDWYGFAEENAHKYTEGGNK